VHCKILIASSLQVSPKLVNASDPRKGSYCALPAVLRLRGTGENRSKKRSLQGPSNEKLVSALKLRSLGRIVPDVWREAKAPRHGF
jgi:hypothetical protein